MSRLQDENRRLLKLQPNQQNTTILASPDGNTSTTDPDGQMLQRLKSLIDKQRHEIKTKDREVQERGSDVENVRNFIKFSSCD